METDIKIALADDEALFRKGIEMILRRKKNIKIINDFANGKELLLYLKNCNNLPDIIIVDINMPVMNGVETAKAIHTEFPDIKVIALTSYDSIGFVTNMIEVGAASYLVKNTSPTELITAIEEVYSTGFYYNEMVLKVINEYLAAPRRPRSRLCDEQLTNRELEVLKLVCKQHSAAEIAEKMFVSIRTIEGHRANLLRKTQCKNVIGLIAYALINNYVSIEDLQV